MRCQLVKCQNSVMYKTPDNAIHMIDRRLENEMEGKSKPVSSRIFEEVVNGNYPTQLVNKMSMPYLEKFVVRLVEYTSVWTGAKIQSSASRNNMTTSWWYLIKDILVDKKRSKKDIKEFRHDLKKIVIYCSEFFRNSSTQCLSHIPLWTNDENFDVIHAIKRKKEYPFEVPPSKKRKTLLRSGKTDTTREPYIYLTRYSPESTELTKSLTQTEFLGLFNLGINNNEKPKTFLPNYYRTNRLLNCPHIPFSSDIGQMMIKKENCTVPSYVSERKLDRLEWYLNKDSTTSTDSNYKTAYVPNKSTAEHIYHFPVKQYGQTRGDVQLKTFIHSICKPLTVLLTNEDLAKLKSDFVKYKVKIPLPRLPDRQLKKHSRKNVIKNEVRQPRILLVNKKIESAKPKISTRLHCTGLKRGTTTVR